MISCKRFIWFQVRSVACLCWVSFCSFFFLDIRNNFLFLFLFFVQIFEVVLFFMPFICLHLASILRGLWKIFFLLKGAYGLDWELKSAFMTDWHVYKNIPCSHGFLLYGWFCWNGTAACSVVLCIGTVACL